MKRILAIILSLVFIFSLTACGSKKSDTKKNPSKGKSETVKIEHTGKKPEETIESITKFNNGIAFANLPYSHYKSYAITAEGYIIFEYFTHSVEEFSVNDKLISIDNENVLLDIKGNEIKPEDKGCIAFYTESLDEGYIIGRITDKKGFEEVTLTGIMNTKFKWVVEPNKELDDLIFNMHSLNLSPENSYCNNGYLIIKNGEASVNLKTGEISTDFPEIKNSGLLYAVIDRENRTIKSNDGEIIASIDFIDGYEVHSWQSTKNTFIFTMYDENDSYYMVAVNAKGEKLFEPISIGNKNAIVSIDDNYIVITQLDPTAKFIKCFDLQGNLIGSKEYTHSAHAYLSDGLIIYTEYSENGDTAAHLLTPKMEVII